MKEYIINFGNLSQGLHEFDFTVDDEFFSSFEYSIVQSGTVQVHVELDKQKETFFTLKFQIDGNINLECDRCLDEISYPIESSKMLLIKLTSKEEEETDDELIFLSPEAYEIDLSAFIYEFINLELPLKIVCELVGKECNQQMIAKLNGIGDQNKEEKDSDDSPWAVLKSLKDNKKED